MTATTTVPAPNKTRILVRLARTGLIAALPLVLTLTAVRLTMSPLFLQIEYNRSGFPVDQYGFTREDRLAYGPLAVEYLLNDAEIDFLGDLRLPREKVPPQVCVVAPEDSSQCFMFNSRELRHMHDVKVVTVWTYRVGWLAVAVAVASVGFLAYRPAHRCELRAGLMGGSILTLGILATIVLLALTAWDVFFTGFHQIFFEGDSWLFRFSDTLIRLFPEQLWFDAALFIGGVSLLGALVIFFGARRWQPNC